jgi:hypothetical protein
MNSGNSLMVIIFPLQSATQFEALRSIKGAQGRLA